MGHYAGTYTRLVVEHVAAMRGAEGVERVLRAAGETRPVATLLDDTSWSTYDEMRAMLTAAAGELGSPQALVEIVRTAVLEAGNMPEFTAWLQSFESLDGLMEQLAQSASAGLVTCEETDARRSGERSWDVRWRMKDGFEPFAEMCEFKVAMAGFLPRLYGYPNATIEEIACVRRGDEWCVDRVTWQEGDEDRRRADFLESKLELAERRLELFQKTVRDLVTIAELDTILDRIVAAAAGVLHAPAFRLELEPLPWSTKLVRGVGDLGASSDNDLVVPVESTHRSHGALIAVGAGALLAPHQRSLLDAYAHLAATALDQAFAVTDARRRAETSDALLDTALRLAKVGSVQEVAEALADAVPSIVDCDRVVVALIEEGAGCAHAIALRGHDAETDALLRSTAMPLDGEVTPEVRYFGDDFGRGADLAALAGVVGCVMVPIFVEDRAVAYIAANVTEDPDRLAPTPDLDRRLQGLAALASTALHNALLLAQVRNQAHHDVLTQLPNRALFLEWLRDPDMAERTWALFLDIDDFKDVNDGLGHDAGDALLRAVADRIRTAIRGHDRVARLGGDEFAILVTDADEDVARGVAARIIDGLQEPFDLDGARVLVSASIGIAGGDDIPVEHMVRNADVAMYSAKAAGKGRAHVFEQGAADRIGKRVSLHADLAEAIERDELRLLFQPVVELGDGSLRGGEALVRWEHPRLGLLTPDRFIGLAEDTGLIVPIGGWVLEQACIEAASWPESVSVAVNLSPRQLEDDRIMADVLHALAVSGIRADRLVVEVTESVIARDTVAIVQRLESLRRLGVRTAIDDFGTGYSSLAALVHLPVDILKIDRGFVNAMLEQPSAAALVQVLIDMGRTLGLDVVAEGVETEEQAELLLERHCDHAQGYLYAKPLDGLAFRTYAEGHQYAN